MIQKNNVSKRLLIKSSTFTITGKKVYCITQPLLADLANRHLVFRVATLLSDIRLGLRSVRGGDAEPGLRYIFFGYYCFPWPLILS